MTLHATAIFLGTGRSDGFLQFRDRTLGAVPQLDAHRQEAAKVACGLRDGQGVSTLPVIERRVGTELGVAGALLDAVLVEEELLEIRVVVQPQGTVTPFDGVLGSTELFFEGGDFRHSWMVLVGLRAEWVSGESIPASALPHLITKLVEANSRKHVRGLLPFLAWRGQRLGDLKVLVTPSLLRLPLE